MVFLVISRIWGRANHVCNTDARSHGVVQRSCHHLQPPLNAISREHEPVTASLNVRDDAERERGSVRVDNSTVLVHLQSNPFLDGWSSEILPEEVELSLSAEDSQVSAGCVRAACVTGFFVGKRSRGHDMPVVVTVNQRARRGRHLGSSGCNLCTISYAVGLVGYGVGTLGHGGGTLGHGGGTLGYGVGTLGYGGGTLGYGGGTLGYGGGTLGYGGGALGYGGGTLGHGGGTLGHGGGTLGYGGGTLGYGSGTLGYGGGTLGYGGGALGYGGGTLGYGGGTLGYG